MKLPTKLSGCELSEVQLTDFARLYSVALMRYFLRRGCQKATVDDLVQDVFVRIAGRASGGKIDNPEAYIMRSAANVWRDFLRKRHTHAHTHHIEYEEGHHAQSGYSPEDVCEGQETIYQFIEALNDLPPRTRQIFMLCRYEGIKQKAVAKRLDISESYVSKHMLKAITYLAHCFGNEK